MQQTIRQNYRKASTKLPKIYNDFLTHYANRRQTKSLQIKRIKRILLVFDAYLTSLEINIASVKIVHIDNFISELSARLAPSTCKSYIYYIRNFVRYLYQDRGILELDLSKLMIPSPLIAQFIPPKFFVDYEIQRLFNNIELSSKRDFRTYAILHLSYAFGLLPREICMVTLDDINFSLREINLRSRRYENQVMLPLSDKTIKAIALYIIKARPQNDQRALFLKHNFPYEPLSPSSVCNDLSRVFHKANRSSSSYWLRHTYAKNLFDMGASTFEIKEILGYERIETAERYLRIHVDLMRAVVFDETI